MLIGVNGVKLTMRQIEINPEKDLIFDLKVREMCKSCKRYGKKATCPPHIESVGYYSDLLPKYSCGILYYEIFPVDDDADEVGKKSSLKIYKEVTTERSSLFADGHYLMIGLGAGSCKLCDSCSFPCHLPGQALIPLEATGIDAIKMMKKFGIEVKFPVKDSIYRIGMLLYD